MALYNTIDEYDEKIKKLQDNYLTAKERKAVGGLTLIPQYWWGDIENEKLKAVIFGKNPRLNTNNELSLNDLTDNDTFSGELKRNKKFNDRDEQVFNLLFDENCSNAYFQKWWRDSFKELVSNMSGIAIYNMFGFYSGDSDKEININESHILMVKGIKEHIIKQIKSCKSIFLLWKGSWSNWVDILGLDTFKGKTIYVINEFNSSNQIISKAIPMTPEELNKNLPLYQAEIEKIFTN